jgi:hypothetical protein
MRPAYVVRRHSTLWQTTRLDGAGYLASSAETVIKAPTLLSALRSSCYCTRTETNFILSSICPMHTHFNTYLLPVYGAAVAYEFPDLRRIQNLHRAAV